MTKLEGTAEIKQGARLSVLPPRAARADELTDAAPEIPNEVFFADPMNLRRLPRQFALTVRGRAPVPGAFEPVAVIAMPAAERTGASGERPQLEFFADRGLLLPAAHIQLREPLIQTRPALTGPQAGQDAAIAEHLDHAQIFSSIDQVLKSGAERYAVHDVARYWDPEALGSSVRADEHYKLLLNDLMTAVLGHKNWKVRFTYQGLPLNEPAPDYLNRRDRRLFYLARRALVKTRAHAFGPFPQDAHVIGDMDVATADAAADDPEILTMNGWSGAVISKSSGLRPATPTLLLQLALSSKTPVKAGDPVLDLLRILTGKTFTAKEAEALRQGEFTRIRSMGSLALYAIRNMGARLAERMEQAARTALAAGSSA